MTLDYPSPRAPAQIARARSAVSNGTFGAASMFVSVAAFTSSWTGLAAGGLKLNDVSAGAAFLMLLITALLSKKHFTIPLWSLAPAVGTLVVAGNHIVFFNDAASATVDHLLRSLLGNTAVAVMVFTEYRRHGALRMKSLAQWWAAGAAANALVAVLDDLKLLDVDAFLIGIDVDSSGASIISSRGVGLTFHPNSLAFALSIAVPLTLYLVQRQQLLRTRLCWIAALSLEIWALLLADSRAGLGIGLGGGFIVVVYIALRHMKGLGIPIGLLAAGGLVVGIGPLIMDTRLAPGEAALSDLGRSQFNEAGWDIFASNPLVGAGFGDGAGTSLYILLMSEGGMVALLGHLIFVAGASWGLFRLRLDLISVVGLTCLTAALSYGLFHPGITERATFWPVIALAILASAVHKSSRVRKEGFSTRSLL